MIHARGLARTYKTRRGDVDAVRGVDLDVEAGEIVGFLGPNGAGKTTTLRMLTTLLRPTRGEATVAGADLRRDPGAVRRRIGYVAQSGSTSGEARAGEEVVDHALLYGVERSVAAARGRELFEQLELDGLWDRKCSSLSGGQRRRLDIVIGPHPHPAARVPRRADHRSRPAGARQPVDARARPARRARQHRVPHHALPRRGRRPVRPDPRHRPRPDRRPGLARGAQAAGQRRRGPAQRRRSPPTSSASPPSPRSCPARTSRPSTARSSRSASRRAARCSPGLLRSLDAEGIELDGVELRRPTLDDVFLTLTGRSLRDGESPASSRPRRSRSMTTTDRHRRTFTDEQSGRSTFVRDTLTVFRRAMRISLRNPVWAVMGLLQPVLYLSPVRPAARAARPPAGRDQRLPAVRPRPARAARHVRRAVRRLRAHRRVARRRHRGRAGQPRTPVRPRARPRAARRHRRRRAGRRPRVRGVPVRARGAVLGHRARHRHRRAARRRVRLGVLRRRAHAQERGRPGAR